MARAARLELADLRAMEEQYRREEMHGPTEMIGGKQFYGAGATPSMGVSQFKGGRKSRKVVVMEPEEDEYEDDMEGEMKGGNALARALAMATARRVGSLARPATSIVARPAASLAARPATSTALLASRLSRPQLNYNVLRPTSTTTLAARPATSTALVNPAAMNPSMPYSYYQNLLRPATSAQRSASRTVSQTASQTATRETKEQILARLIKSGIPLATAAVMTASIMATGSQGGEEETGEYYDDIVDGSDPTQVPAPQIPPQGPAGPNYPEFQPEADDPSSSLIPSDLNPNELAWYLRSGNLPDRYGFRKPTPAQRGKGVCKVGGRTLPSMRMDRNSKPPKFRVGPQIPVQDPVVETEREAHMREFNERFREAQRKREEEGYKPYMPRVGPKPPPKSKGTKPYMPTVNLPESKPDGRQVRAEIVKKIMKERGVNLARASQIVKAEGLY